MSDDDINSAFKSAIERRDLINLELLLQSPDANPKIYESAILAELFKSDKCDEIMELFIKDGRITQNVSYIARVILASVRGDIDLLNEILKEKDKFTEDVLGSALHSALIRVSMSGNTYLYNFLLNQNELNIKSKELASVFSTGSKSLMIIIQNGHYHLMKSVLEKNDPANNLSILIRMMNQNNIQAVTNILQYGNIDFTAQGNTILQAAVASNNVVIFDKIMTVFNNIKIRPSFAIIQSAIENGSLKILEGLLNYRNNVTKLPLVITIDNVRTMYARMNEMKGRMNDPFKRRLINACILRFVIDSRVENLLKDLENISLKDNLMVLEI